MDPNEKKQTGIRASDILNDDDDIINEEEYIDSLIAIFTSKDSIEEDDDINDFLRDYE